MNSLDKRSGADVWDRVWRAHARTGAHPHTHLLDAIARRAGPPGGRRVLEVGAGLAVDSAFLAAAGDSCIALDFSGNALSTARTHHASLAERGALVFVRADATRLPFAHGLFDVVFSQGLLEHFAAPRAVIVEQHRVTRTGGVVVADVPQRWNAYALWKRWLMARDAWFAGWETDFTLGGLERLARVSGGRVLETYGYGYFPSFCFGIRNAHTFDQRHATHWRLPESLRARVERVWRWLERQRPYYALLVSVGVVSTPSDVPAAAGTQVQ